MMSKLFIFAFFVAVVLSCEAGFGSQDDKCVPCTDGYYSLNDVCTYCNGKVNRDHTSCAECASGERFVSGSCVSTSSVCSGNSVHYGDSEALACDKGYFGVKSKSCVKLDNGEWGIKYYNKGCFSNVKENGGIPAGMAAINIVIHTRGLPAYAFTPSVKVHLIYALVSQFPFAIGDIQIGAVISKKVSVTSAPECVIYIRIITQENLVEHFTGSESDYSLIASQLTFFLINYSSYTFHSQFVVYLYEVSSIISFAYECAPIAGVTVSGESYYLGDEIRYDCPVSEDEEETSFLGKASRKCILGPDGPEWSSENLANCYASSSKGDNNYHVNLLVTIHKLNRNLLSCNLTLELYPIFVNLASTHLDNMYIYDIHGISETSGDYMGALSTQFRVGYSIRKTIKYYENPNILAVTHLWSLLDTANHRALSSQKLTQEFIKVHEYLLDDIIFSIDEAENTQMSEVEVPN
ncbi:hypothetical protein WA158_002468 [Blastocystis sp. Blastoise]